MKKIFILLVLSLVCRSWCMAQDYAPTTNWPYLLPDFEQGTIYLGNGTYSSGKFNIHLLGNKLQCIAQYDQINSVTFYNIDHVNIAGSDYRPADGKLMECVGAVDSTTFLLHSVTADFDAMIRLRMPYGMEGKAMDTENVKRLGLKGISNERYTDLRPVWFDGEPIPLLQSYVFLLDGKKIAATQKGCSKIIDSKNSKDLKALVKSNKLKWNNPDDLMVILRFLKDRIR